MIYNIYTDDENIKKSRHLNFVHISKCLKKTHSNDLIKNLNKEKIKFIFFVNDHFF